MWYTFVRFGAGKSPGSPHWSAEDASPTAEEEASVTMHTGPCFGYETVALPRLTSTALHRRLSLSAGDLELTSESFDAIHTFTVNPTP